LPFNGLGPGPGKVGQGGGLKSSTDDVTHKKSVLPKQTIFFRVQTRRLAASFEPLTRSVCLPDLRNSCIKPRAIRLFWHEKFSISARRRSVK